MSLALCVIEEIYIILTVEKIGEEEKALQAKMPIGGYIETRDDYLSKHGLYDQWRGIYKEYVELALEGDVEALKRAIFYAWFQLSEPGWLSGISELPDDQTKVIVELLENRLSLNHKDEELEYMLQYYMQICEYYLERFYPQPLLQKASESNDSLGRCLPTGKEQKHRGKMGRYWGQ